MRLVMILLKEKSILLSPDYFPRKLFKWKANNIHTMLKHTHNNYKLTLLYFNQYPPMVKTAS